MPRTATSHTDQFARALARNRLGTPGVLYFALAGIGTLLVAGGVIPAAFAATGLTGIPAAFLMVAVVLAVFSPGYVAMSRQLPFTGAFYAFVSRGLGRPAGVGASFVALAAYNLLQVALYGAFGPAAESLAADDLNLHAPWWIWSLFAWFLVLMLGLLRVDLTGRLLGVLSLLEIAIVAVSSIVGLSHPAGGHISFHSLSPASLSVAGLGAALAIAVLAFVGFEMPVLYNEETRGPKVIPRAIFLALGTGAVIYALASLAMNVHYGAQVTSVAQSQGTQMLPNLAPGMLASVLRLLFLTSVFAALISFHNACWRYTYSLSREHVISRVFEAVNRHGVPWVGSLVQSLLGLLTILVTRGANWDAMGQLFYWGGTTGGFGVLILLAFTAAAVVRFFAREHFGEPRWRRLYTPLLATVLLGVMVYLCAAHYATLLGVSADARSAKILPALYLLPAVVGAAWGLWLKARKPSTYAVIGSGSSMNTGLAGVAAATPTL